MRSARGTKLRVPADGMLLERARLGDRAAFTELYRRHVGVIFNVVRRLAGPNHDCDELVQEIFYQAYRNLSRFEGRSTFLTWLYRIATNVSYMHLKRLSRQKKLVVSRGANEHDPLDHIPSSAPDPLHQAERRSFYEALLAAVLQLPFSQRVVVVLGPIQGHSYREMTEILSIPVDAIKGRLHRARVQLRRLLKDSAEAPDPGPMLTARPLRSHDAPMG